MDSQPIDLGPADVLLSEGRMKAKLEQMPFMVALKIVVAQRLKDAMDDEPENKPARIDDRGDYAG